MRVPLFHAGCIPLFTCDSCICTCGFCILVGDVVLRGMLYLCGQLVVSVVGGACIPVGVYLYSRADTCNKHRLYLYTSMCFYKRFCRYLTLHDSASYPIVFGLITSGFCDSPIKRLA